MPWLRVLFVLLVARPVVKLWLGLTIRHQERLPLTGPAIVVANHNSHLDILTLYSLFPLAVIRNVQPAAAADYFLKNRLMAWFATQVVGIIPVKRGTKKGDDPLAGCRAALADGRILILFPEGTRGEPEVLSEVKSGIWHLAGEFRDAPVIPVYMHGLGRALGRGQWLPIPFFVDVAVGRTHFWQENRQAFKQDLRDCLLQLRDKVLPVKPNEEEGY
ncbi:lysophospholipid acyltransferase family protein [Chitinilyticum aquatile]|uniref:lysophospholipid acyltransferase family protein n=1 Tax=Chitinilyticum aquatile TaxID=362520 RepID=UPI00054EBD75|nr:lysophospholipid acyltransferase family protein [Chitinilyticum aquatile]